MTKPTPLSGFPEWLPAQRIIEQQLVDRLRDTFELHGFTPLRTRAVEPLEQLLRKGETSNEVYVLRRLQADDAEDTDPVLAALGLHFDLTVPFARYVLENAGKLHFPFRRYQIQPAWRGERPQEGRYREFLQADIDVVDRDELPLHHDVEILLTASEALTALPIPPVTIRTNNRKVCEGFYRGIGLADPAAALRAVDKLDRLGPDKVAALLAETAGATAAQAKACLALGEIGSADASFADRVRALGVSDSLLDEGLAELVSVVEGVGEHTPGVVAADLSIARGLDYYTGTVFEVALPGVGVSIGAGGRYDNLATSGTDRYPGVGISIGVTRTLGVLFGRDALTVSRPVPTCVLVAVPDEASRPGAARVAASLRRRGIPTEVSPSAAKYGKQIRYADRRGIPYVWFPDTGAGRHEVKDIRSGDQAPADPDAWNPPAADLRPAIAASAG